VRRRSDISETTINCQRQFSNRIDFLTSDSNKIEKDRNIPKEKRLRKFVINIPQEKRFRKFVITSKFVVAKYLSSNDNDTTLRKLFVASKQPQNKSAFVQDDVLISRFSSKQFIRTYTISTNGTHFRTETNFSKQSFEFRTETKTTRNNDLRTESTISLQNNGFNFLFQDDLKPFWQLVDKFQRGAIPWMFLPLILLPFWIRRYFATRTRCFRDHFCAPHHLLFGGPYIRLTVPIFSSTVEHQLKLILT